MGDHKNMNEYYPPDFDPEKLPRMRQMGGQARVCPSPITSELQILKFKNS